MVNYFKNHPWYQSTSESNDILLCKKLDVEIWDLIDSWKRILEIWYWRWLFAKYFDIKGVEDYTWIDIDDFYEKKMKKKFPKYDFFCVDFQSFLSNRNKKYDIVILSHVFEHLDTIERVECIQSIYNSLNNWGIWINYMPNADSILDASHNRYADITHNTIYSPQSFEQIVLTVLDKKFSIEHRNNFIGFSSSVNRIIHKFFLFFTKLYYSSMWFLFPRIYTSEMISILKK